MWIVANKQGKAYCVRLTTITPMDNRTTIRVFNSIVKKYTEDINYALITEDDTLAYYENVASKMTYGTYLKEFCQMHKSEEKNRISHEKIMYEMRKKYSEDEIRNPSLSVMEDELRIASRVTLDEMFYQQPVTITIFPMRLGGYSISIELTNIHNMD